MHLKVQNIFLSLYGSVAPDVDSMHGLKHKNSLFCQYPIFKILFLMLRLLYFLKELIYGQSKLIQIVRIVEQTPREGDIEVWDKLFDMDKI